MPELTDHWERVSKSNQCPVCKRGDWCCVGAIFVNCMRVESDLPCKGTSGGWLHRIDANAPAKPRTPLRPAKPEPPVDCEPLWQNWDKWTTEAQIENLASLLGVDFAVLNMMGVAWADRAWAFPMRDGLGKLIGIRFRTNDGDKWTLKGTHSGLFMARNMNIFVRHWPDTLFVVEGATDTGAALSIGLAAIGRPSCLGCEQMVNDYIARHKFRRAVIVADNDLPGQKVPNDCPSH